MSTMYWAKRSRARDVFHDTRGDLELPQPEGDKLGTEQGRAFGHGLAQSEHEPIGGGVQDLAELVGRGIAARGPI